MVFFQSSSSGIKKNCSKMMSLTSHLSNNDLNILSHSKLSLNITTASEKTRKKLLEFFNKSCMFIKNAKDVTSAIRDSALLQILKIGLSAKKYVTSAIKHFPYEQILTKKGVTEQINVTFGYGAIMQTLMRIILADLINVTLRFFASMQTLTWTGSANLVNVTVGYYANMQTLMRTIFTDLIIVIYQFAYMEILTLRSSADQINVTYQFADIMQILTLRCSADQINVIFGYYVNMQTPTRTGLADLTSLICGCVIIQMYGGDSELISNLASEERSKYLSAIIVLYRNIIRNETGRMMKSIDMVASEAKYLFGDERSCIFLLLLNDGLLKFESPVLAANFVPNMADSTVRKHVISFFEYVIDMMNRQMTLLLSCSDKERFQEMPEPNFISLLQTLINSSLKPKIEGEKQRSLKESKFILVDKEEFEKSPEEENREIVLNRHRHGDEKVVNRFVDERREITRASARRKNRPHHSIFFPTDCRLFIYIPTEYGSYWYENDMKRANKTSRNGK